MKKTVLALLVVATLAACGGGSSSDVAPVQRSQPAPLQDQAGPAQPTVVVQPQADSGSGIKDMLLGALVGNAVTNMLSGGNRQQAAPAYAPQVIERRTVTNRYIERPAKVAPTSVTDARPAPVTPAPSKPASSGYGSAYAKTQPAKPASSNYRPSTPSKPASSSYRSSSSSKK